LRHHHLIYNLICHNNDATSALNETCDDASTLLDKIVPLGEFRDEQLAKARELENIEIDENCDSPIIPISPTRVETPKIHYKKRHIREILGRMKKVSVIHMTLLSR